MTKIMIVDDIQDIREMIESLLQNEGFETKTANNGKDFLEKIDKFQPDLVSLDVMMPGLSTETILKKIKKMKSNPKIILLTVVRYTNEEKKQLFDMGNVVDYIKKPFEIDEYLDIIKNHI